MKILASISAEKKDILIFKKDTLDNISKIKTILKSDKNFAKITDMDTIEKLNTKNLLLELRKIDLFCEADNIKSILSKHKEEFSIESDPLIDNPELRELKKHFKEYELLVEKGYLDKKYLGINKNVLLEELSLVANSELNKIKTIRDRIDYLQEYYIMLKFMKDSDLKVRELLEEIMIYPSKEWGTIFDVWFISNFLSQKNNKSILRNDHDIRSLNRVQHSIRILYPQIIKTYWYSELVATVRKYSGSQIALKSIYNLRGANGKRRNSLRTIMKYDFDSFTNFFPIVLTNPNSVSSILPLKLGLFDLVIFDEASQLKVEDTFASFLRGKIHIISGDEHQMPPSSFFVSEVDIADDDQKITAPEGMEELKKTLEKNHLFNLVSSESLLEFASQLSFSKVNLDIHYRSKHPDLIEFSNKAFYGSRLVPTPPIFSDKAAIKFYQIDGVYHSEDNTNLGEVNKIVQIVKDEYNSNQDSSIGVATLNLNQRNLVLDRISELSTKDDKFAKMMNKLDSNGFFVKNLENIQGDERDIIIISTTFGLREDKSFIQNFGPITKKGGYRLLNVIITRAKERLHLITSIPQENYSQYEVLINKEGNDGKAIFYAYLAYAKSVSEGNSETKAKILNDISNAVDKNDYNESDLNLTESPFEEEVYQRMTGIIPKEKIHLQQKVGGFRLDIVVDTKQPGKKIAIECDGATYHRSEEDHYWDVFRQEYLENFGYVFHRIWSENWFDDPASETRKLLAFIESNDGFLKKS